MDDPFEGHTLLRASEDAAFTDEDRGRTCAVPTM